MKLNWVTTEDHDEDWFMVAKAAEYSGPGSIGAYAPELWKR
jgi:hypothetical protein